MYGVTPLRVACDAHPDYPSSRFAARLAGPPLRVQHHHAHVLACMADNALDPPVLGVAWDGTGYGLDGTVWGGEFLRVTADGFTRADHLRTFRLPGGDRAVVEPRRAALGLLYELYGESIPAGLAPMRAFAPDDLRVTLAMLRGRVNSPVTSSAGRLFDAVASLLDLRHRSTFEGQAAMDLEFAAYGHDTHEAYDAASTDWESLVRGVVADLGRGVAAGCIAAKFHNTLVEMIVAVALREREERIVLTGGCFQNRHLTERAVRRLRDAGLRPYWHQRVPPNDGGIAVGQLAALAALR
jgi:hydrogenase maturation protein HypF